MPGLIDRQPGQRAAGRPGVATHGRERATETAVSWGPWQAGYTSGRSVKTALSGQDWSVRPRWLDQVTMACVAEASRSGGRELDRVEERLGGARVDG